MGFTRIEDEEVVPVAMARRSILTEPDERGTSFIENIEFVGCVVLGPVHLRLREDVNFVGTNDVGGGKPLSDVITAMPDGDAYLGALDVRNCTFANCTFKNVQIIASPDHDLVGAINASG